MKKALVQGTRICEIADAEFPVHASLIWVTVPDDTTAHDTYVDGAVVKYSPPVPDYKEQRRAEYPPILDYMDGVVKGDLAQMQAYIDACLAVKAKYPKP
jgi:hypothetical protein